SSSRQTPGCKNRRHAACRRAQRAAGNGTPIKIAQECPTLVEGVASCCKRQGQARISGQAPAGDASRCGPLSELRFSIQNFLKTYDIGLVQTAKSRCALLT